jgi:hypothetical protein
MEIYSSSGSAPASQPKYSLREAVLKSKSNGQNTVVLRSKCMDYKLVSFPHRTTDRSLTLPFFRGSMRPMCSE